MVLPILIEKGPYVFKVIGKIKERDARKLEKISGVIVKRNVISVVDESKGALAAVCPVWLGAGVQNKLLEYFSMGVPAITTTIGLEGLNAIPEKDVLVAKTPEMFVEKIEFLKNSPEKRKMISLNARRYIEQNHSWSKTLFGLTKKINKFF
jgi:glycosyltransferase involved in cell wall biosynthesis